MTTQQHNNVTDFNPAILDTSAPVVFFPVRHHSPMAARLVRELAEQMRPKAILIEGPSNFAPQMAELALLHQLPIAIYSYARLADGTRRGAFYPFCDYSPEWQALQIAHSLNIPARFIDLAWADLLAGDAQPTIPVAQRYADGELRRNRYIVALCDKLGVDGFDTLWDTLFEIDPALSLADYLHRAHTLLYQMRADDNHIPAEDLRREAFMVAQIRQAQADFGAPLLVVTGGFHSYALWQTFHTTPPLPVSSDGAEGIVERGIALTPYSYARLDSLTGYEAGMPHPGFYDSVWQNASARETPSTPKAFEVYHDLLAGVVTQLRERGQTASTADWMAVETMAQGLASLRGHARVWRTDLVDGIIGALVKEALDGTHQPFLAAVYAALRGDKRGQLATGAKVPPLVSDLRQTLQQYDLEPHDKERTLDLDLLAKPDDLARSHVLHRLVGLSIAGYELTGGTDLVARDDLTDVRERWRIIWSPDFDATCIQAAIYGATLADAGAARLAERARGIERDAQAAALLLLDAALMGVDHLAPLFEEQVIALIRDDGDFFGVSAALGHLLYLYRYDAALGTTGRADVGAVLVEAWGRGLWLLEGLGRVEGKDRALVEGVRGLLETFERCATLPALAALFDRAYFVAVLRRSSADPTQSAVLRGATTGALWVLNESDLTDLLGLMAYFADPQHIGDYLTGLFALAREAAQRQSDLVVGLDAVLMAFADDDFLAALPALRLAFSSFTPREKHYLVRTLLQATGASADLLPALTVDVATAARALALEGRLFSILEKYGLGKSDG